MNENETLLDLFMRFWYAYTFFATGIIAFVVIWALRTRQFKDQKHASNLPLEIDKNRDDVKKKEEDVNV